MAKLLISFLFFHTIFLSPAFGFILEEDKLNIQGASHLTKPLIVSTDSIEEDTLDISFLTEGTSIGDDDAEESADTTSSLSPVLKKELLIQIATEQSFQEERFEGIISKVYSLPENMTIFNDNLKKISQKASFKGIKRLLDPRNPHAVNALFEDKKLKGTPPSEFLRVKFTDVMHQTVRMIQRHDELTGNDRHLLVDRLFIPQLLLKFLKDQRDSGYNAAFFLKNTFHSLGKADQKKIKKTPIYLESILNLSRHLLVLNRLISQINLRPSSELSFSYVRSLDFWGNEGDASYDAILESCLNSNPLDPDTVAQLYGHYTQEEFTRSKDGFNYLEIADSEFLATLRVARYLKEIYDQLKSDQRSSPVRFVERTPFRPSLQIPSRASSSSFEMLSFSPASLDHNPLSFSEIEHPDSAFFSLSSFRPISASDFRSSSFQGTDGSSALLY